MFKKKGKEKMPQIERAKLTEEMLDAGTESAHTGAGETNIEEANAEESGTEEMLDAVTESEQTGAEEPNAEEANIEETNTGEPNTGEVNAEEANTDEPNVEEPNGEEDEGEDPVEAAYCLGAGIDSETLAKAKEMLGEIAKTVNARTFRPDMLQLAIRMLRYDEAIESARKEGRAEVQTERIEEAARRRRAKAEEASALPHFSGTKGLGAPLGDSIFDIAKGVR